MPIHRIPTLRTMPVRDPVLSVAAVQSAEQALFDTGTPPFSLMQRAGDAAARWIWRIAAGRSVTVLCGPGNNGGDGYIIAARLQQLGADVAVIAAMEPATESAKKARAAYTGKVCSSDELHNAGVFVDCLFGSGQNRALSDTLHGLVQTLRARHDHHVAIDLPSGVQSDSGALLNRVTPYDTTLALGAWKWAHWTMPAREAMGRHVLVDIGLNAGDETGELIGKPDLGSPAADAHKYTRGLVAVVAGAMPGAAALCSRAAQHGGAGYVKLLCQRSAPPLPDSVVIDDRPLSEALADKRIGAIVVGPGLGRDDTALGFLAQVLETKGNIPTVIDADALHLLSPDLCAQNKRPLVLTPHEGELNALAASFDCSELLQPDCPVKLAKAMDIARAINATVVAKGPDTFVYTEANGAAVACGASPWLSTAGTGDVLAGLIASRLATGRDLHTGACDAVWLHGEAARLAGPAFSADGLVARLQDAYAACL